ncbi:GNAT family N-acetyltransferase [Tundrisphaera lichenicola]|uniref:GNAT family N-acetyltransferase n=1 Tax=Tundrisphaera lichenicola TaxID=2029860 RepID=UPI003EC08BC9
MIRIRVMSTGDLALGLSLKQEAGWNQTEADWARFHAMQPDGCFVGEFGGRAVATLTTCLFGPVAWIAMVLVRQAYRGRGIGRALMDHALDFLDDRGVRSVRLDATPLGQVLYERLRFVGEYPLARWSGVPEAPDVPQSPRRFDPAYLDRIEQLDRSVTGTDRGRFLRGLAEEFPEAVRVGGLGDEVDGFLMGRPGSNAWQIGPCIAQNGAGSILLADALGRLRGRPVLVDIPSDNSEASALARASGLIVQRPFLRMCRGEKVADEPSRIWASSGPEMG